MDVLVIAGLVILVAVVALLFRLTATLGRFQSDLKDRTEADLQTLKSELVGGQMEGLLSLRSSLDSAHKVISDRLAEGAKSLEGKLSLIGGIENRLGELAAQARSIEEIGLNIQSLADLLKPPKLRGAVGEVMLENLLGQMLPRSMFAMQHTFPSGRRVDAIIRLGERLLPIDSKFPLEAYQRLAASNSDTDRKEFARTIRKHIDDISERYILPVEGSMEFAVMYIPAEAVYYRFVADDSDGFEYSLSRKVIPSSPGSLYGFLASLSAIYMQAGLITGGRRLADGLVQLGESIGRLEKLHQRMDGSVRSMATSLGKARDESRGMSVQLKRLKEPGESTDILTGGAPSPEAIVTVDDGDRSDS